MCIGRSNCAPYIGQSMLKEACETIHMELDPPKLTEIHPCLITKLTTINLVSILIHSPFQYIYSFNFQLWFNYFSTSVSLPFNFLVFTQLYGSFSFFLYLFSTQACMLGTLVSYDKLTTVFRINATLLYSSISISVSAF